MEKTKEKLSDILKRRDGYPVSLAHYDEWWHFGREHIMKNANIRSYLKVYRDKRVLVKVPSEFIYEKIKNNKPRQSIFYTFDNPILALKVAYILSVETDGQGIKMYDKDGFIIGCFSLKKGIISFAPTTVDNSDSIELFTLEQCFDRLCGIADNISYIMEDDDTAEELDRVSYRIQQITEALEEEVQTLYRRIEKNV